MVQSQRPFGSLAGIGGDGGSEGPPILAFAAAVTTFLTLIFRTGHPIIAIWVALAIVSWLFIAGATIASGN